MNENNNKNSNRLYKFNIIKRRGENNCNFVRFFFFLYLWIYLKYLFEYLWTNKKEEEEEEVLFSFLVAITKRIQNKRLCTFKSNNNIKYICHLQLLVLVVI